MLDVLDRLLLVVARRIEHCLLRMKGALLLSAIQTLIQWCLLQATKPTSSAFAHYVRRQAT